MFDFSCDDLVFTTPIWQIDIYNVRYVSISA